MTGRSGASRAAGTDVDDASPGGNPFTDPTSLEAFVDDVVSRRIGDGTPGATVAVVGGESDVFTKGYGRADLGANAPVRANETAFRVGSVGKLVTWTAVMQGVERGLLDLDVDVNAYLGESELEVPATYDDPVTLRHLGTHTSGFESALDPGVVTDPDAISELETTLVDRRPSRIRPPGETVGYSNYGAALAGHVVAEVNDTTFEEYVQSEIFEPLGMTHSTFAQPVPDGQPGTLATGHTRNDGAFSTAEDLYIDMGPAGSMWATASDVAAFMNAHLGDGAVGDVRILDETTTKTMHERHHVRHPAVTNWRYGFHEYGGADSNLLSHSGATINFTSRLVLVPDHDVAVFVNYNVNNADEPPAAVVDAILDEYELRPSSSLPARSEIPDGRGRAERVAGEYSATYLPDSGPLKVVDVLERVTVESVGNGTLVTRTLDGKSRRWIETEPYVYREIGGRDVIAFDVTDDGVEAMHVSSEPTGEYLPVSFHDRRLVTVGVLGASLSGFGLSLGGWGAVGAFRRLKRHHAGHERDAEGDG